MNNTSCTWLNNGHTFWDQTLLKDLLEDYSGERHIFVVPGAINDPDEVSMEMKDHPKVLVIVTSDEENKFPIKDLYHPDMKVFMTYPNTKDVDGYLPIGYRPETRELVKENGMSAKKLDWFFSGQINNHSREQLVSIIKDADLGYGLWMPTGGFAQGMPYKEYMEAMCAAKVVPCPMGNVSPDSFRLYEALEAGCIPVPENKEFWTMLFGEVPFPVVDHWGELPEIINHFKDRQDVANKCAAWWQLKKGELKWKLQS